MFVKGNSDSVRIYGFICLHNTSLSMVNLSLLVLKIKSHLQHNIYTCHFTLYVLYFDNRSFLGKSERRSPISGLLVFCVLFPIFG